ncbi:hypothetical protein G7085_07670 [Tessaracoccus sp. HDW20]|nr:polysaccharide deacetylase family protein [Tessaracoccus coleopterorum]NHB84523.1 hypothetical protein [Tessaracoccus coleopterorum]
MRPGRCGHRAGARIRNAHHGRDVAGALRSGHAVRHPDPDAHTRRQPDAHVLAFRDTVGRLHGRSRCPGAGRNHIGSAEAYTYPSLLVQQWLEGEVKPTEKIVFLTFDDGPNPTTTPTILKALKAAGCTPPST